MVTDRQVRKLFDGLASGQTLALAAERAGMHRETARRYRRLGKLPSEVAVVHGWRFGSAMGMGEGDKDCISRTIFKQRIKLGEKDQDCLEFLKAHWILR